MMPLAGKRKADASPVRNEKTVKRAALGNVTNAVLNAIDHDKNPSNRSKGAAAAAPAKPTVLDALNDENVKTALFQAVSQAVRATKVVTRASTRAVTAKTQPAAAEPTKNATTGRKAKCGPAANNNKATAAKLAAVPEAEAKATERRHSSRLANESGSTDKEDSHYVSALEDL